MLFLVILLKIILYILLFILGLAVLLLVLPFSYSGEVLIFDGYKLRINLGWAWNFIKVKADIENDEVAVTLHLLNKRLYKLKTQGIPQEEEPEKTEQEEKVKKLNRNLTLKDLTNKEFLQEIFDYIKRVLNMAKPKYLHIYGAYGFDDPAVTGLVCGFIGIVKALLPEAKLQLEPVFNEEILELDIRIQGSMTAGALAYQTLRTVSKKPVRNIIFKKKEQ